MRIGTEFLSGDQRFRCTDIGTRVVAAIRADEATVASSERSGPITTLTISSAEADAMGWFDGPSYGMVEHVFDEDDREGCEPG